MSAPAPVAQMFAILKKIDLMGVPAEIQQKVRDALPVREGDQISSSTMPRILNAVRQVDEHFGAQMNINPAHEATLTLALGAPAPNRMIPPAATLAQGEANGSGAAPLRSLGPVHQLPEPPADAASNQTPQRIRVGGNVQAMNLIQRVTPPYPPDAKAARVQGLVRFQATIGKDGSILDLDLVSGPALLVPAATEAVKQWLYKPTLLNGQPVEVITGIDVNFTLSQ